ERGQAGAGAAGEPAEGGRHEAGGLLVPGQHQADAGAAQRFEQRQGFFAWNAEDVVGALGLQGLDEQIGSLGHAPDCRILSVTRAFPSRLKPLPRARFLLQARLQPRPVGPAAPESPSTASTRSRSRPSAIRAPTASPLATSRVLRTTCPSSRCRML